MPDLAVHFDATGSADAREAGDRMEAVLSEGGPFKVVRQDDPCIAAVNLLKPFSFAPDQPFRRDGDWLMIDGTLYQDLDLDEPGVALEDGRERAVGRPDEAPEAQAPWRGRVGRVEVGLGALDGEAAPDSPITYDRVLVSVGRKPNASDLGLENTAVAVNERGFIEVNETLQTAEPNLYAIGDVVGDPMLAHKASHEGRTAVEAIRGEKVAFEPAAIPAVIFTDPELAWAGLTETEAKERNIEVKVAKFPWAASGRATTIGRNDGLTKLIIDPGTDRVLGMGVVGAGAGELIAEGVLAIEMAALASDIKHTIHPHPTLSETVMEAAEVFYGQSTHVYRPRRD